MLLKRVFDVAASGLVLLLMAPVFVAISIWIKLSDPGPLFFVQERIGQYGKPFNIFKFRSMIHEPEETRRLVTATGDHYITKPGMWLRKYKLDELPQLVNILSGKMSVVGPRPEVKEYVDYYSEEEKRVVLSVKPGLTDYAAIEFRNEEELLAEQAEPEAYYIETILVKKIALYQRYVAERSMFNDLKLIFATFKVIVS